MKRLVTFVTLAALGGCLPAIQPAPAPYPTPVEASTGFPPTANQPMPSPTPSATATPAPTPSPTRAPAATPSPSPSPSPTPVPTATPTPGPASYQADIVPIMRAHCARCHSSGGSGSFAFTMFDGTGKAEYPGIRNNLAASLSAIESGYMPLDKATQVTPAELATLKRWRDADKPEN